MGRVFWDPRLPDFSAGDRNQLFDSMNASITTLHTVDVEAVGLADYGPGNAYIERQISRWAHQYRTSTTEPIDAWIAEIR